jgi:hypothetical protein
VIRIFGIQNNAVCGDLNPGVVYILEAKFLQKIEQVDQKPEIYRQYQYVGSSADVSAK